MIDPLRFIFCIIIVVSALSGLVWAVKHRPTWLLGTFLGIFILELVAGLSTALYFATGSHK